MNRLQRQHGIAIIIVLLVSVVALGAIVAATSVAALSSRQVSAFESAGTVALMAAESGHNTLLARKDLPGYAYDPAVHDSIEEWLSSTLAGGFSFGDYELPGGAQVQLSALGDAATGTITIRSVGIAPNEAARRILLQDYQVAFGTDFVTQYSDAALVTKSELKSNSAKSYIRGLSESYSDWIFEGPLSSARDGEYVLFGATKGVNTVTGGVTYRVAVLSKDDRGRPLDVALTRVSDADANAYPDTVDCEFNSQGGLVGGGGLCGDPTLLIPFALREDDSLQIDGSPATIKLPVNLSTLDAFGIGDVVHFGDDAPNDLSATIIGVGPDYLEFAAERLDLVGEALAEGTPVRGKVLSAIAEGGCNVNEERDTPQGCESPAIGDLWKNTFGNDLDQTTLRAIAMATDAELGDLRADEEIRLSQEDYLHWLGVERAHYNAKQDWPNTVAGLTWIDDVSTKGANNRLCGSGIVVLNTGLQKANDKLNLTTQDCEFRGVIYILGQAKLVGNLSNYQGVVFIEAQSGVTEMQGGGRKDGTDTIAKALYNAIAVRDAFSILPGGDVVNGVFADLDRTLRLGTLVAP